ncbi:G-D-S-L family lipolytic protein [Fictibacillus macauensis ZFHKF-1]|uniref:G-D-S-L family lipolytic protein n=1 Tax=Fictibacillus macauensis ZFHKF-1 TaxID=1196324 RepID=I8UG16_9BACL|nr:GDSL-type esterase/lipase family protein [Fictibacillus macauensis]EIT85773.1 G-D-S-L family lipolytic protein [Fictibacillus macauensis ZFHKF-1]
MKRKGLALITAISIASALLWIIGLGAVIQNQWFRPSTTKLAQTPTQQGSTQHKSAVVIAAIGDSLTRGTGDVDGKGYIGSVKEQLQKKTKKQIWLSNAGIKGQTSSQLLQQLNQPQIQRGIKEADIILMTIGGNDLFRGGRALQELQSQSIKKVEQRYISNLKKIYKKIRTVNNTADVYHIGLYDPFSDLRQAKATSHIVRQWNFDSAELAASFDRIVYVPTFDLFQLSVNDYLYSDHFHPNRKGYQLIGERAASLIHFSEEEKK